MTEKCGVIVGCSKNQEWLLPWWWMNYGLHNSSPVTFINFGDMSEKAQNWCRQRGDLKRLDLSINFIKPKEALNPKLTSLIEQICGTNVWEKRASWFKKPFAFQLSPYSTTIWLDLDCQVCGSIKPIFEMCDNEEGMTLCEEPDYSQEINFQRGLILPGEILYNTGVVAFKKNSPLIEKWVENIITKNHILYGDQQVLSWIIFTQNITINPLPAIYNWRVDDGPNENFIILHWFGSYKETLENDIKILKNEFFINLEMI